jgi:hypothetical protein
LRKQYLISISNFLCLLASTSFGNK